ncbi:MAG: hypothetical protein KBD76_11775 [Bacteriovorax sp.]|nr:hypothetical protein [Bacteriovorax sp.]
MKLTTLVFLIFICFNSFAAAPILKKMHPNELGFQDPPGYSILLDQVFKFSGQGFEDKIILFADQNYDSKDENTPKVFIFTGKEILSSQALPGIDKSWHISDVRAISMNGKKSNNKKVQMLAIINFTPPSGVKDSWLQSFVFDISNDGKIFFDLDLNTKLGINATSKKPIKTIKELLNFTK